MFLLAEKSKLNIFPCLIFVVLLIFWNYDYIEAHGGVTLFKKQVIGPYEIQFGTSPKSPSPGPIHIALRIVFIDTGNPLDGATVHLSGRMVESEEDLISSFERVFADQFIDDPAFWDADVMVSEEGNWSFKVIIENSGDLHEADYGVKVKESNPLIGAFSVIGLILFLSVLALAVRTYFKPKTVS
jgi:hypothetical protein|tara:strand:+ start:372 stop:926 length:555 start_codon:yes stop_codon:yes gene_type:complete